ALRSNVGELAFRNRLRIPPLLEGRADDQGRTFDLGVATGQTEFVAGMSADTWGVNGSYLGPTLRARVGEEVRVNVTNRLPETTTIHWHGMHLPAAMDGGPHQPIAPGATWSPSWRVDQPAATLWYHAHPDGHTGEQVYRGVAGLFLLDDPAQPAGLPGSYGVDDIPLVIQDKRFTGDGQLDAGHPRFSPVGVLGDEILVNGTHDPYLEVTTTRVRFRALNASNGRTYDLGLSDDRPFSVVAGDAGLLPAPHPVRRLRLAPSERAEVVVDVTPGDDVLLRGFPTGLGAGRLPDRFAGGDDTFDLLRLTAADQLEASPALPERLPAPPPVAVPPTAPAQEFRFNHASRINGRAYDPDRVDFAVAPGSTEVWELRNTSDNQHVFHVHGVSFTVVDYDGAPPPAEMAGRKDSVFLPRGTTVRIAVPFRSYADAHAPYMFHCHVLAHEDHGMMGQFVVSAASGAPDPSGGGPPPG
ncbi:MAG TPA: multicopper oxidase domain-containing protein, partial [Acidimicrobiia bacterium]|nr:multicopper oxidase domain-containing protein [Acidimicrobiia bacterium]